VRAGPGVVELDPIAEIPILILFAGAIGGQKLTEDNVLAEGANGYEAEQDGYERKEKASSGKPILQNQMVTTRAKVCWHGGGGLVFLERALRMRIDSSVETGLSMRPAIDHPRPAPFAALRGREKRN
jgi:hypothetical protein